LVYRQLDFSTDAETGEQVQIQEEKPTENEITNQRLSKLPEQPQDKIIEIARDVPMEKDFDFTYEVNPAIRRFFIKNESPYTIQGQFGIVPKSNNFLNFRIPCSFFNVSIRPHSNTCVLTVAKIFPSLGWGDYEIRFYIHDKDSYEKVAEKKKDNSSFLNKILNIKG